MARILNYGSIDWKPKSLSTSTVSEDFALSVCIEEKKKELMDREKVWVADPLEGFIRGNIVDLGEDTVTVEPLERGKKLVVAPFDRLYPAEDDDAKEVDDNCGLMYLNEATLLNNIKRRYDKDKIYTYVANILIAINPYSVIKDLYASSTIKIYQGRSLGTLPPHIFAIADKAFRDMKVLKQSQSIIVSGESGAGKTESTKYILKYLCDNFGQSAGALESKILNANPILEAFGNAKTTRNNNSSRFGKFIEIHFDSQCRVVGGYISHYLLERARVTSQASEERNYHIFYQLCAGAPADLYKKLHLNSPDHFHYLRQGCTQYFSAKSDEARIPTERKSQAHLQQGALVDPIRNDAKDFQQVDADLEKVGMDAQVRQQVYSTIATVLHLGNIEFEDDPDDNRGGCRVTDDSEDSLQVVASLMGLDADELRRSLTARVMQAAKGGYKGTVIMVPLKVHEATNARDALAKAIYSSLFDFIVKQINDSIPFEQSSYYIGVLDIAGFEYFTVNSFEQFCINYCNEKLQQFFNQRILKDEQELYEREGLGVKRISFVDNQDCIDLIEAKGNGIFSLLDEESKLPKPSNRHFTLEVHERNGGPYSRLALPRHSKERKHREIHDENGFVIRHFAGTVCYQTAQFIEKNNDALHASLEVLVQECQNSFVRGLFATGEKKSVPKGKLTFISVGSKFQTQLASLMEKLESTGTSFIRCIKPNVKMIARTFEGGSILSQLQCAGMTSVLELMQQGYPSRTQFSELYSMYKKYMPPKLARLDPRLFCKALFKALGLDDNDFKFGLTKVFFRPGKFAEFDQMMKADPKHLQSLIEKVYHWILCSQWKKAQWGALSVIKLKNKIIYRREALVVIQKFTRMYLAKKKHAPRFKAIKRLRKLVEQITQIEKMSQSLTKDQAAVKQNAQELNRELQAEISWVRATFPVKISVLDARYQLLVDKIYGAIDSAQKKIKDQKIAEEQERMKKLQREMEAEKQRKIDEEKKRVKVEQEKKLKAEMEVKRRTEEAEMQKKMVSKATTPKTEQAPPKYDLSNWTFVKLRDSMNTSCDIEFLSTCRQEIFRRSKVYHDWQKSNKKEFPASKRNIRVPKKIVEEVAKFKEANVSLSPSSLINTEQRYFRLEIPNINVELNQQGSTEEPSPGRWYAHFDGDWIGRQMELYSDREPLLSVAGKDSIRMCEFRLEETGLTRIKGCEILEKQFEKRWIKHGGQPYTPIGNRQSP